MTDILVLILFVLSGAASGWLGVDLLPVDILKQVSNVEGFRIVLSIIGSFLVGFFISKRLSYSIEKILLSGFFSCFTSFSGFIYFLYKILNQGDWIKFIIFFNLIIIVNLFTMVFGFWISRKIT